MTKNKILWRRFFRSLNIFSIKGTLKNFAQFDEVTNFRLINSFIVALGFSMLIPVLTILQGTLMLAWVISVFEILKMIGVKTNEILVHTFSTHQLYKTTILLHIFYTIGAGLYYLHPIVMIYIDSFLSLMEIVVISAYSIKLNSYIAKYYPDSVSTFQIVKNSSYADGALIGLLLSTITLYFLPISYTIGVFILVNTLFGCWLVYNWNFYKGEGMSKYGL